MSSTGDWCVPWPRQSRAGLSWYTRGRESLYLLSIGEEWTELSQVRHRGLYLQREACISTGTQFNHIYEKLSPVRKPSCHENVPLSPPPGQTKKLSHKSWFVTVFDDHADGCLLKRLINESLLAHLILHTQNTDITWSAAHLFLF